VEVQEVWQGTWRWSDEIKGKVVARTGHAIHKIYVPTNIYIYMEKINERLI